MHMSKHIYRIKHYPSGEKVLNLHVGIGRVGRRSKGTISFCDVEVGWGEASNKELLL